MNKLNQNYQFIDSRNYFNEEWAQVNNFHKFENYDNPSIAIYQCIIGLKEKRKEYKYFGYNKFEQSDNFKY